MKGLIRLYLLPTNALLALYIVVMLDHARSESNYNALPIESTFYIVCSPRL